MKRKLTLMWWWLVECWWSFPFRPVRKSPLNNRKLSGHIMCPKTFDTFKDVGTRFPLSVKVAPWKPEEGQKETEEC